jgi:putative nucleotidyltransferase with HDIG domain
MTSATYYSTLGFMVLFFSTLACLVSLATWYGFRRKIRGTGSIMISFLCLTLGITIAVLLRSWLDRLVIQVVANLLEAIGSYTLLVGFAKILERQGGPVRARLTRIGVMLGAANIASILAYLIASWMWFSNLIEGLSNAIPAIAITVMLLNKANAIDRSSRVIAVGIFALIASFFGAEFLFLALDSAGIQLGAFPRAILDMPNPIVWTASMTCLSLAVNHVVSGVVGYKLNVSLADVQETHIALERTNRELNAFQKQILVIFAETLDHRTKETSDHVVRVAACTEAIMLGLGYDSEYAQFVSEASTLHDIGKVGIPDSILRSEKVLSKNEREVMNSHVSLGYEMLNKSDIPFFRLAAQIAYEHHERWDGTGYPLGRKGEEICLEARVVAVADTFDALQIQRNYKEAWPIDRARAYILKYSGSMFDPRIVDIAMQVLGKATPGFDYTKPSFSRSPARE